jgi:tetratricopeptide (TPR) repeat protein
MIRLSVRRAVVVALCLFAGAVSGAEVAARAVPLNDTEARAHLEQMEKQGVLREPVWAHAYWARSASAPNAEARIADLRWALRFDPDLTPARRELCGLLFRERDTGFATEAVTAISRGLRSFVAQQRAAAWIFTILGGAFGLSLVAIAALMIGKEVGRIRHGVRERLHFLPLELREGAAWLTILVPFALVVSLAPTAALFWALLIGTIGAWTSLEAWPRRVCVWALAAVMVAPTGLALWTRIMEPAFPDSYLRNLWVTQRADPGFLPTTWHTDAPDGALEDPDFLASLALLERRAERYGQAAEHLERAVELRPEHWAYHNNLGNVRLLQGESDRALAAYEEAARLAPKEALVYVNTAQAFVQRLEFNEADQALTRATDLGYRLPPVLNDESEGIIVRDHSLGATQLWLRFLRGEGLRTALGWRRALEMTLRLVFPMRPFWLSLPLFLTLYYAAYARTLPRVFPCAACGRSVCRKCHYRTLRRSLCAECYAIQQDVQAPLKRDAMIIERRRRVSRSGRTTAVVLSALLPGTGLLLLGSRRRALAFLGAGAVLLLIAAANAAWPAPGPAHSDPRWPSAVVAPLLFFALLAILSVRSYLRAPVPQQAPPPEQTAPHSSMQLPTSTRTV